jgi:hypothetical protein
MIKTASDDPVREDRDIQNNALTHFKIQFSQTIKYEI